MSDKNLRRRSRPDQSAADPKSSTARLPLEKLHERHEGLTFEVAQSYIQAAEVCLDRHHASPQEFLLDDDRTENSISVEWRSPDARTKRAWANTDDATRDGAYACALAATELSRGLVAVSRAETLTGADYYVAPVGEPSDDLENTLRLEVSGTDSDRSGVRYRLRGKVRQAQEGASDLPALAAVVGFKARLIMIQTVEET